MAKTPPPDFRELAKRRLQRLHEPSSEEALKEIEEARQRGDLLLIMGGVRILMVGLAKRDDKATTSGVSK
jgi:hypothetical protein